MLWLFSDRLGEEEQSVKTEWDLRAKHKHDIPEVKRLDTLGSCGLNGSGGY